jgi:hypothetical protein
MKTYNAVEALGAQVAHVEDEDAWYRVCWQNALTLVESFASDLTTIAGGEPRVFQLGFKKADTDFQGAATCYFSVRYDDCDDFRVTGIALIEHHMIYVRVSKRPRDARFEAIADILDKGLFQQLRAFST